jgi:hypothetical protein
MSRVVAIACVLLSLTGCETLGEMGSDYPDTRRQHSVQSLNDGGATVRLIQVDTYWSTGQHAVQTMQYEVTNHRAQPLCFGVRLTDLRADLNYLHEQPVLIEPGATEIVAYAQGSVASVPIAIDEWDYFWSDDRSDCTL